MGSSGGSSGGGAPNAVKVRKFPFAYNTPGLAAGHTVFTPTVGDVLLDLWLEVDTAWNGTTPFFDVGTFTSTTSGIFAANNGGNPAALMSQADAALAAAPNLLAANNLSDLVQSSAVATATANYGDSLLVVSGTSVNANGNIIETGNLTVPAKFTAATPLKVIVSTDGTTAGSDPGATQGAAVLYLVTATPA